MGKPRILYDNKLIGETITASSEATGYPKENLLTWREYELWKGDPGNSHTIEFEFAASAGESFNCLGIAGHNLFTCGARIKLEGCNNPDDSAPTWTNIVSYFYPGTDFALAEFFNSINYLAGKLTIDNNGGSNFEPYMGIFFVGNYLEIENNPDPEGLDEDAIEDITTKQISESGHLLGNTLDYSMRKTSWKFSHLTPSWFKGTWLLFRTVHRNKPFIWVWDYESFGDEVYLMQFEGKKHSAPRKNVLYRTLNFNLVGLLEE